jgi:RimJ/RimL family protein N-acetyltransferase
MPAMLDDPDAPTIYRVSGSPPFPDPAHPSLPEDVLPRRVTLRDSTLATIVPFASQRQVPSSLLRYLNAQFNKEIERGDTYPMTETMPFEKFATYWFQNFGAIMVLGQYESADAFALDPADKDWSRACLGTFYIKPNYPGRSSHVCNGGFIVTDAARNRGVGRSLGEAYLDWAPKLGYSYSVFNLVYVTNTASTRLWDRLGFKRIGRVKGCGQLKSSGPELVDAIIYGKELTRNDDSGPNGQGPDGSAEPVSDERFDRIRYYLKTGLYPASSDRAEKSRLRSASMHYRLEKAGPDGDLDDDGEVLMLRDKIVVIDPGRQMEIATRAHIEGGHGGINKTTARIAEKYHWSRIKETVSDAIRTCEKCREAGKPAVIPAGTIVTPRRTGAGAAQPYIATGANSTVARPKISPRSSETANNQPDKNQILDGDKRGRASSERSLPAPHSTAAPSYQLAPLLAIDPSLRSRTDIPHRRDPMLQDITHSLPASPVLTISHAAEDSVDPKVISQPSPHIHHPNLPSLHPLQHAHAHPHRRINPSRAADAASELYAEREPVSYADLLNADDAEPVPSSLVLPPLTASSTSRHALPSMSQSSRRPSISSLLSSRPHSRHRTREEEAAVQAAVDRDMEMLIEPQDDDEEQEPEKGDKQGLLHGEDAMAIDQSLIDSQLEQSGNLSRQRAGMEPG